METSQYMDFEIIYIIDYSFLLINVLLIQEIKVKVTTNKTD